MSRLPDKYDVEQNAISDPVCKDPGTGSLITTNDYTIPCSVSGQGVDTKVEVPIIDLTIGQLGSLFNNTITVAGEMEYVHTTSKVLLLSFKVDLITQALVPEVIKATLYKNGTPLNGGLQTASIIVDNVYQTTLSLPVGGGPVDMNDVFSLYVANLSSATDVTLKAGSIICGAFSFLNL